MAACIPRTKATKRAALWALMAWSGRALPGLADPHRAQATIAQFRRRKLAVVERRMLRQLVSLATRGL